MAKEFEKLANIAPVFSQPEAKCEYVGTVTLMASEYRRLLEVEARYNLAKKFEDNLYAESTYHSSEDKTLHVLFGGEFGD